MVHTSRGNERGSTLPVVVLVVMTAAASMVFVALIADRATARAEAQAVADAAALAGAVEGLPEANALTESNGARLVDFFRRGDVVTVEVERDGVRAAASARWTWDGATTASG